MSMDNPSRYQPVPLGGGPGVVGSDMIVEVLEEEDQNADHSNDLIPNVDGDQDSGDGLGLDKKREIEERVMISEESDSQHQKPFKQIGNAE